MSTSIGGYGNTGTSIILSAGIKQMTLEQQALTWETSGGTLSETYAGLGASRSTVIALAPRITQITAWQGNISTAQNNLTMTSSALADMVTQAQALSTNLLSIMGTTESSTVTSVATEAQTALTQLGNTLNTSNGVGYIFAGQDSSEPPIPDGASSLDSSSLATQIASIVSTLSTAGASSVMEQATTAAMDNDSGTSVFSTSLSVSAEDADDLSASVITGSSSSTTMGIVATQSSTSSSASATSTGSPIRDLMRDMMVMSAMSGMSSSTPGYSDLVTQLNTSLQTTISQLGEMEATVGTTQSSLTSTSSTLTNVQTMLETQVTNIQGADIAQVATETSALSTNLEASYELIAKMKSMTLASYI
ncbi:flagellin [Acetobacter sp. TBRC 12305]|uniref:Flagellin n=1 Tax=Acetobacter garciniae TaxID=2817435 RepID=A0A939HNG6_9PROT|nr:flagellin [Acetobacter garciniae]MBO1324652.1 flagellin [Acetobacter garciniae]MBX0344341.1 flagellin [Acetobacter garciniae]